MVATSTGWMDATAFNALNKNAFINVELQHSINVHFILLEHLIKLFSLNNGSGESVKQNTTSTLGIFKVV